MRIKITAASILATLPLLTAAFLMFAPRARAEGAPEPRTVLALYDSHDVLSPRDDKNVIHDNAEMALNYLGMKVVYHDISKGLPDAAGMEDVRGIILWVKWVDSGYSLKNTFDLCGWLLKEIGEGKKFILMGTMEIFKDETGKVDNASLVGKLFNSIGLEYGGDWTDNPFIIDLVDKDPGMVEFERTLDNEIESYERVKSASSENKVYLRLNRTDIPNSVSDVVVTTPRGGYILEDYDIFVDERNEQVRWRINPFLFFAEALGLNGVPAYDTTTLFGMRIFYSHIDGDGLRSVSLIDNKTICGEVIYNEILKKYDLPFTVSFISSGVDPRYFGSDDTVLLARDMLKLDNVELGAHGFTHPLDWDRKITALKVNGYSRDMVLGEDEILSESAYSKGALITAGTDEMLRREITEAADYINSELAPAGKKVVVNQWTGNCRPSAEAIDRANEAGLLNINGGDTRFDRAFPSYTNVAPLTRQVDGRVQVYTSNANENIYTNGWLGPYDGFKNVIETFDETENSTLVNAGKRRVSPINIYYHFYSGEREASLAALKEAYDHALNSGIIPVFTSRYIKIVNGFLAGRINRLVDDGWEFSDYGDCRTVRLDGSGRYPDLSRSRNIMGFSEWNGFMYVHLADTGRAALYLTGKMPVETYIRKASSVIDNCAMGKGKVSFTTRLFREGTYELANMSPAAKYAVKVFRPGEKKAVFTKIFTADADGNLKVKVPVKGTVDVVIERM